MSDKIPAKTESFEERALRGERRLDQLAAESDAQATASGEPRSHGGELPPGVTGIAARWSHEGTALLRDTRTGFSVLVPGKPLFVEPGYVDAHWAIADALVFLQVRVTPAPAGVALADAVAKMTRDLTKAEPQPVSPPNGARVAARGLVREPTRMRAVDVLGGGAGGRDFIAVLVFNYTNEVDAITLDTVRSAVLGSAWFHHEPSNVVTEPVPPSRWVADGLPLALRGDRPALPEGASAVADTLLARVGLLPPATLLEGALRADVEQLLVGAVGAAAARPLVDSLGFVHDVRGLVFAMRAPRA